MLETCYKRSEICCLSNEGPDALAIPSALTTTCWNKQFGIQLAWFEARQRMPRSNLETPNLLYQQVDKGPRELQLLANLTKVHAIFNFLLTSSWNKQFGIQLAWFEEASQRMPRNNLEIPNFYSSRL